MIRSRLHSRLTTVCWKEEGWEETSDEKIKQTTFANQSKTYGAPPPPQKKKNTHTASLTTEKPQDVRQDWLSVFRLGLVRISGILLNHANDHRHLASDARCLRTDPQVGRRDVDPTVAGIALEGRTGVKGMTGGMQGAVARLDRLEKGKNQHS